MVKVYKDDKTQYYFRLIRIFKTLQLPQLRQSKKNNTILLSQSFVKITTLTFHQ